MSSYNIMYMKGAGDNGITKHARCDRLLIKSNT